MTNNHLHGRYKTNKFCLGTIQEDPYQLRLFGKSTSHIEVLAGEFLPDGKNLYLVVADADSNIHVLQYDPERTLPFPPFLSPLHLPYVQLIHPPPSYSSLLHPHLPPNL